MTPFQIFMAALVAILLWALLEYLVFCRRIENRLKREKALKERIDKFRKR